ncbi:MAG: nucleotidyltransferase family protein [Candidatus Omnitrophota bacterium]
MKTLEEIKKIFREHKKELEDEFQVKKIAVFGSYAKGTQNKRSDIDVLVEFKKTISLLSLVKTENFLTSLTKTKVDLIPKEDIRRELKDKILKEALYV